METKLKIADRSELKLVEKYMGYTESYLSENVSWNDIMPVVDKIENEDVGRGIMFVTIVGERCKIAFNDERETIYAETVSSEVKSKIESVWKTIIKYLTLKQQ